MDEGWGTVSFKGTEYYREIASFPPTNTGMAHWRYMLVLCDHIDEQDKKIEQLKTHLDTYAEVIGQKQQENAELQYRVGELEEALRAACDLLDQLALGWEDSPSGSKVFAVITAALALTREEEA